MKKRILSLVALVSLSMVIITSCKKKDKDEDVDPSATQVCDGNGSSSYYPLAIGNSFVYTSGSSIFSLTDSVSIRFAKTFNSKSYYAEVTSNFLGLDTAYYREDATTHDIYTWNGINDALYIPGSPAINQSLPEIMGGFGFTAKVTNLSASYTTSSCTYSNLLEITVYDSKSAVYSTLYYKKGLGKVADVYVGSSSTVETTLKSVTLK